MKKTIHVSFPGGKKVYAEVGGRVVHTDQSVENGGDGTAPEPFLIFMISIATCAGVYALNFCERRALQTQDMSLSMRYEFNREKGICKEVYIDLKLPTGFPEKYKKAVLKAMDLCAVKRHMMDPPEFVMSTG